MKETLDKAIFDHIKSPVVVADTNGIIDMNSAFLSLVNFSEKKQLLRNPSYTNTVQEVIASGSPSWRQVGDSEGRLLEVEICPSPLELENHTFLLEFNQFRDEFLGIVDQSAELSTRDYIDAVARLFEEPFIIEGTPIEVKVSAGYANYPKDGESIDELVSSADSRMYHEKRRKRILENPVRTQISLDEAAGTTDRRGSETGCRGSEL